MEDSKKRSISSFKLTKKKVLKIIGKNLAKNGFFKVMEIYPKLTRYLFEIVHKRIFYIISKILHYALYML